MKECLRLAWLALRGQLRGGVYVEPMTDDAKLTIDHCRITSRVGDVPLFTFAPDWPQPPNWTDIRPHD